MCNRYRPQSGAVIVEALIVTAALVLLLSGLFNYSQGFMEYESLLAAATAGARAGAHYSGTHDVTTSAALSYAALTAVRNYLTGAGMDLSKYQVTVSGVALTLDAQAATVSMVRVVVARSSPNYFFANLSESKLRTRADALMRVEGKHNLGSFVHTYEASPS